MEKCVIFDNNMTTGLVPRQESTDNQRGNWFLRFDIKILALYLYLVLLIYANYLLNKLVTTNKNLTGKIATNCKSVKESSHNIMESALEERERNTLEMEFKETIDNGPFVNMMETPVKHKYRATPRKIKKPKRHLAATDLTNLEPVNKKKYQEWNIIIDFHDLSELKKNPRPPVPSADNCKWPNIEDIKQQPRLKSQENETIRKEECASLHTYIHYTDHVQLQRAYTSLQELLPHMRDGCKFIQTEHQTIIKVLMVTDGLLESTDSVSKIAKEQDTIRIDNKHGRQDKPCYCCKSREQSKICSHEAPDV